MGLKVEWFGEFHGAPAGEEGWALLGDLRDARPVATSRTTRTDAGLIDLPAGAVNVHRKVYEYRGIGALLRGAFRTTFAAPGRARREADALRSLGTSGFAPPPVGLGERRVAGFLVESRLAVRTVEGATQLDGTPPALDLARALGRRIGMVHRAGLGELSLSPRNVLAARSPEGSWSLAKVDSGRLRRVVVGGLLQARDIADLLAGLEGRWRAEEMAAFHEAYAAEAGGIPGGTEDAMAAARERLRRRLPRTRTT